MAFSALGNSFGLAVLGIYCFIENIGIEVAAFQFIPLISFCFMIFMANIGILSLPFLILSEILPEKIKAMTTTFLMLFLNILAFLMIKVGGNSQSRFLTKKTTVSPLFTFCSFYHF